MVVRGDGRTRIGAAGPLRELASGIDALYLSARTVLTPSFLEQLDYGRRWAEKVRLPTPCEIGEETLGMAPHGWGRYRFCLEHPLARVGVTTSRHVPTVRVQPRAETLHALGPAGTVEAVRELLRPALGELSFSVSRVDLFSDWQGWELDARDADRFVCRADARRTFEVSGRLTGFTFGTRTTKTVCARLYDKTADMAAKGTRWWLDVWGPAFRPGEPVHRVEFEIAREMLTEFGLSSPAAVLGAQGDLWAYATGEWLTYRTPTADRTRSRWPVAEEWRCVQQAPLSHRRIGAERIRATQRAASLATLLPGLTGYMASFAAVVGTDDIADTVGAVGHHLHDYEVVSRTSFADRVERRRADRAFR